MDVEDAFTEEAITNLGTNVADETEEELKDIVTRIYTTNEIEPVTDEHINVAMLCFVAGRTYQSAVASAVTVEMSVDELREYSLYLLNRSRT